MIQTIYIAGAISSDPDYIEKFAKAEKNLKDTFPGMVVNPVRETQKAFMFPEKEAWDTLMLFCLKKLSGCTHIYLLPDYYKSHGACIELMWAQKLNLVVVREEEKVLSI